jgi:hypothetical protein
MATPYTVSASRFTLNADGTLATEASDLGFGAGAPMPATIAVVGAGSRTGLRTSYTYSRTRYSDGEVWGWEYHNAAGARLLIFND